MVDGNGLSMLGSVRPFGIVENERIRFNLRRTQHLVIQHIGPSPVIFSQQIDELTKYKNSGEVNFRVEDKAGAMEAVKAHFESAEKPSVVMDFDGYRLEFPDWWFNIRPSNTEPYLRFICEATSEELLQEKISETDSILVNQFGGKR